MAFLQKTKLLILCFTVATSSVQQCRATADDVISQSALITTEVIRQTIYVVIGLGIGQCIIPDVYKWTKARFNGDHVLATLGKKNEQLNATNDLYQACKNRLTAHAMEHGCSPETCTKNYNEQRNLALIHLQLNKDAQEFSDLMTYYGVDYSVRSQFEANLAQLDLAPGETQLEKAYEATRGQLFDQANQAHAHSEFEEELFATKAPQSNSLIKLAQKTATPAA